MTGIAAHRGFVRGIGARLALLAIVAFTVGCDRITKAVALRTLAGRPRRSLLAGVVRLEYVENRGGFLGLGADLPQLARVLAFGLGTAALLVFVALLAARRAARGSGWMGLALVWAGGVANLVDRVTRGSVVDFLNVGVGPLRTGIFNVADLAIVAGCVLVVVEAARRRAAPPGPVRCDP